jgi:uncharacterized membrane protein
MLTYYVKLYTLTLVAFFAIDMVWLGLVARTFYRNQLGSLMASNPNWYAAIIFYLLFVAGILVFVVLPGLQTSSLKTTLLHAAFFGLITYATYDLTNLATLKNWPLKVTLIDMAWGVLLSVLVSYVSILIANRLN